MANFRGLVGGGVGVGLSYGLFGVIHDTFGRLHESVVHPAIATCETPVVPAVKALHPVFGASLGHLTEHSSKVVMFGVAALAAAYTGYVTWKALRWLRSWKLSDLLPVGRGRVQSVISNLADGIFQMDRKVSTLEEAVGVLHNAADSGIASVQTEVNVLHTKMKRVNRTVDRVEETVSRVEEQANSAQQGLLHCATRSVVYISLFLSLSYRGDVGSTKKAFANPQLSTFGRSPKICTVPNGPFPRKVAGLKWLKASAKTGYKHLFGHLKWSGNTFGTSDC